MEKFSICKEFYVLRMDDVIYLCNSRVWKLCIRNKATFFSLYIVLQKAIFLIFFASSSRFLYLWITTPVIYFVEEISISIRYGNVIRSVFWVCLSNHMAVVMSLKFRLARLWTLRHSPTYLVTNFSLANLKAGSQSNFHFYVDVNVTLKTWKAMAAVTTTLT